MIEIRPTCAKTANKQLDYLKELARKKEGELMDRQIVNRQKGQEYFVL